jgi:hypothetical protein
VRYGPPMSIKRSKELSSRSPRERDADALAKAADKKWNWTKDVATQPEESFQRYATTGKFTKETYLLHSKFGRGVVTNVEGAHIDVLFEDGVRKLLHAP